MVNNKVVIITIAVETNYSAEDIEGWITSFLEEVHKEDAGILKVSKMSWG